MTDGGVKKVVLIPATVGGRRNAMVRGRDAPGGATRPVSGVVAFWRPKSWVTLRNCTCWIRTAATMMPPLTMFCASVDRPLMAKRLVMVEKTSTPSREPTMVPRPPLSSVPPMMAAAIASSSYRLAMAAWAELACAVSMIAAMPQQSPESA